MVFKNLQEVIKYVKENQSVPEWIKYARHYSDLCSALIDYEFIPNDSTQQDAFKMLLIQKIEQIESEDKSKARNKYARPINDMFERILTPIQNVFAATGGVKDYNNGDYEMPEKLLILLMKFISNTRDGKSVERYLESIWMNLYHTDPSGVMQIEYITNKTSKVVTKMYPSYKGIHSIRNYTPKGQLVECIIYEPKKVAAGKQIWTVIDDVQQWSIIQDGDTYNQNPLAASTFIHPFGEVPVIINSDIINKKGIRLSPIHNIIPQACEYARDQSIKTIFKFLQGFPKFYMMRAQCYKCNGTKIDGDTKCTACNATGYADGKTDVVDVMIIPPPVDGMPPLQGNQIAGFIQPDIETWDKFTDELTWEEQMMFNTQWGIKPMQKQDGTDKIKTATQIMYDTQPQINKLNKYADVTEWIEWKITNLYANAIDVSKDKTEDIALIRYGRRYILEGVDQLQQKYEEAKAKGENNLVLDGLLDELLIVKFKNDPEWMQIELKKSRVEPYIHLSNEEINNFFGSKEMLRKAFFQPWWKDLEDADLKQEIPALKIKFATDFKAYLPTVELAPPPPTVPVPGEPLPGK